MSTTQVAKRKILNQKCFKYFVWAPLGKRVVHIIGKFTAGVVDTDGKFATSINDTSGTSGKFTSGDVDTSGAP